MLKRIGPGITVSTLSLISTLLLDTIGHNHSSSTTCFLDDGLRFNNTGNLVESPSVRPLYTIIPYTLNAFAYMLLYIGAYEFILAQSPHAMKGLLIGTFFAIKGVFQLLAVLTVYLPFIGWSSDPSFPSCGFVYYLINITIAFIGTLAYIWAAAKYQHRRRDDMLPNHIFVECCYSGAEDDDLLYRVKDEVLSFLLCVGSVCNQTSSQPTRTQKQETATGTSRRAKIETPDLIKSRNMSEK